MGPGISGIAITRVRPTQIETIYRLTTSLSMEHSKSEGEL
jgi:hypothetical protein